MQSRVADNLFFAGEVLNIDGIMGDFNFQLPWTTGWLRVMLFPNNNELFEEPLDSLANILIMLDVLTSIYL